jgi:hypothetical protein
MPRFICKRERNGETVKFVDPGFLTSVFLGAALAIYFDTKPENAIAWGLGAGFAGPAILRSLIDSLLKRLGLDALPPTGMSGMDQNGA